MSIAEHGLLRISCATEVGEVWALIDPIGAGLHALHVNGREVMPIDGTDARQRWYSGHTLAPWPNRLRDGRWMFNGAVLQAPANDGLGNAIHGLVAQREFEVTNRNDHSVTLQFSLGGDAVYPFAVVVTVAYSLTADGVTCLLGGRNIGDVSVPFAIGSHPYLPFDDECTLTINASQAFEVDERLIPTGRLVDLSAWSAQSGEPVSLASFQSDDCFTGLRRGDDGLAHTVITHPDGWTVDVWQSQGLPHTVIFATREFTWSNGGSRAIAIEPQTAPTNALNSGVDLTWLAPGESVDVAWGISAGCAADS